MEREEIVRDDFPTVRKGWSPEAVEAHLKAVADSVAATGPRPKERATPAADAASERVGAVLAAAESAAAEIVEEAEAEADRMLAAAEAEADQIRAAARTESEQTVNAASREASGRVEQAQAAVEGLVAQADRLRVQVGALGRDLASNVPGFGSPAAPEPGLDELPETPVTPAGESEPEPASEPEPPLEAPEPAPEPSPAVTGRPTDDELIARLRPSADAPEAEEPSAPAGSGSEQGAARLVAMNMALDGSSREQIAEQLRTEFGGVDGIESLLDDVLQRASR